VGADEDDDKATAAEPAVKARKSQPVITPVTRFEPDEIVAERYRITKMIAHGGMGDVYEATDADLRSDVALKTIRGASSGPRVERFRREIYLARKVTHPNVCRVFDLGRHKTASGHEIVFITMELLRGETLSARIKAHGKMATRDALPIIRQIAAAIDAAHAVGVVHRDLKPGNVMLVPDETGGPPRAFVTDFGVAHAEGDPFDDLSGTGDVVGSPAYMAPEQIEGDTITGSTDIYAFGIVIFEMVTGVRPFQGETSISAIVKRLKVDPPRPTVHAPALPAEWDATIMRCLARDPKLRFASGQEIVDALTGAASSPVGKVDPEEVADSGIRTALASRRSISSPSIQVPPAAAASAEPPTPIPATPPPSIPPTPVAAPASATGAARTRLYAAGVAIIALGGGAAFWLTRDKHHTAAPAPAPVAAGSAAAATSTAPESAPKKPEGTSIAVLPFTDTSPKKDQEWLSDGFSEELLVHLAKIKELRVVGRSSAFSFKNSTDDDATIAKKLGVTNLVEGSVAKIDDRVRITARLINAADGTQLWGETFDRNGKDVFAMQSEIATAVAKALQLKLVTEQAPIAGTTNADAHEKVLRGRLLARSDSKEDLEQSAAAYQAAIDLDPKYAEAYAGLAYALSYLADRADTAKEREDDLDRAQELAHKAVALGPDIAATHRVLANILFSFDWDWDGARASLARALELEPRDADTLRLAAQLASYTGDTARGTALAAQAVEIEPLISSSWNEVGIEHIALGEYTEARKAINHALELNPSSTFAKGRLAFIDLLEGNPDAAFARAETITIPGIKLMLVAMAKFSRGRRAESQAALDTLIKTEAHTCAYQIAEVYAWRGDLDKAFEWLDKAYELRDGGLQEVRNDPLIRKLHSDPRFNTFLAKMKLPPL
jgi:serine/threonine protein kinase/TolB-like protein/tetratricopeptide (TPR) repeat protein